MAGPMAGSMAGSMATVGVSDAVHAAAGSSLSFDYDANAAFWTPGTGPDVASALNREGTVDRDIAQGTASKRPHAATVGGLAAFDHARAATQGLTVSGAAALNSAADEYSLSIVMRLNTTVSGTDQPIEISNGSINTGILIFLTSSGVTARAKVVSSGLKDASAAFTDKTSNHILRATLKASGMILGIDGTETLLAGSFGGLVGAMTDVDIGFSASGANPVGMSFFRAVGQLNPTAAQVTDVEAALASLYGVTL